MREAKLVETPEEKGLSRRDLLVKGGLITAGATFLGDRRGIRVRGRRPPASRQDRRRHPRRHRLVLVRVQEGRRPGGEGPEAPRRQRHAGLREQRRREAGRGHQCRHRREGERDRDVRARRERAQGRADEGLGAGHRDHHRQLRPRRLRHPADLHGPRRPDRGRRRPGRRQAVPGRRREEGPRRHPRGEQLRAAAAGRRRQDDPRWRGRQGADDPEREVGHPGHEGQGRRGLQGRTRDSTASSASTRT